MQHPAGQPALVAYTLRKATTPWSHASQAEQPSCMPTMGCFGEGCTLTPPTSPRRGGNRAKLAMPASIKKQGGVLRALTLRLENNVPAFKRTRVTVHVVVEGGQQGPALDDLPGDDRQPAHEAITPHDHLPAAPAEQQPPAPHLVLGSVDGEAEGAAGNAPTTAVLTDGVGQADVSSAGWDVSSAHDQSLLGRLASHVKWPRPRPSRAELLQQLQQLGEQLKEGQMSIDRVRAEAAEAAEAEAAAEAGQREQQEANAEQLRRFTELQHAIDRLQSAAATANSTVAGLQEAAAAAAEQHTRQAAAGQQRISALEAEIASCRCRIQQLEHARSEESATNSSLRGELAAAQASLGQLQGRCTRHESDAKQMRDQAATAAANQQLLQLKLQQVTNLQQRTQEQLDAAQGAQSAADQEATDLRAALNAAQAAEASAVQEAATATGQKQQLQQQVSDLQARLQQAQQQEVATSAANQHLQQNELRLEAELQRALADTASALAQGQCLIDDKNQLLANQKMLVDAMDAALADNKVLFDEQQDLLAAKSQLDQQLTGLVNALNVALGLEGPGQVQSFAADLDAQGQPMLAGNVGMAGQVHRGLVRYVPRATRQQQQPPPVLPTATAVRKVLAADQMQELGLLVGTTLKSNSPMVEVLGVGLENNKVVMYVGYGGQTMTGLLTAGAAVALAQLKDQLHLCLEFVKAVKQLHDAGLVHWDLKPDNVVVSSIAGRLRVRLIDLGLSQTLVTVLLNPLIGGTQGFISPALALKARGVALEVLADTGVQQQAELVALLTRLQPELQQQPQLPPLQQPITMEEARAADCFSANNVVCGMLLGCDMRLEPGYQLPWQNAPATAQAQIARSFLGNPWGWEAIGRQRFDALIGGLPAQQQQAAREVQKLLMDRLLCPEAPPNLQELVDALEEWAATFP